MMHAAGSVSSFAEWRERARAFHAAGVPPQDVLWSQGGSLFADTAPPIDPAPASRTFAVPREFFHAAERVAHARDESRWALLYRVLWRLTCGEPWLMQIATDDDVFALNRLEKAVHRDAHKMKAFVRFRKVEFAEGEHYIAWHRPDHLIVPLVAPFFADRFSTMRWTIFTPDASVAWRDGRLAYGGGVPESRVASDDALEEVWKTYYAAIFNPARIKLRAMRKEMPVRHWATLPETRIIGEMLAEAPSRVEKMLKTARALEPATAAPFVPVRRELPVLAAAAAACQGCAIHCNATQTVFGHGPAQARCMVVGEQPGDQEDLAGRPFVGPAGQVLDAALIEAGIARDELYLTNAVKHFKWEPRGQKRIHARPSAREVGACRPWLEAEIESIRPDLIICLGVTAAQSLLGAGFRLSRHRGVVLTNTRWAPKLVATVHPSFLLRIPDAVAREQARLEFVADLRVAGGAMR